MVRILAFTLLASISAHASTFSEVRDRVYAQPLAGNPAYDPALATAIFHALRNLTGELIDRAKATLTDSSDFKPAAPKLIHALGICAAGTWKVTEPSFATGLLSPSLEIPALVRFSMARAQPVFEKGTARNFAMAVKLFPAGGASTRNILTLDQTGLTGDERRSFFFPKAEGERIYFTNNVPGTGFLAWLGQRTFEKLDPPSTFRALYPLAEVTAEGAKVERPVAPRLLWIEPRFARAAGPTPADFRDEIRGYGHMKFDLVIPAQYGVPRELRVGTLEVGDPVVSSACDLELTFHHAPEKRDRWKVQP